MTKTTPSVLKRLQIIFSISSVILLASSLASYYSLQKMITSSGWVNHTYEVLAEAENLLSTVKDAETAQRGFLLSQDPVFLQPYEGAYERTVASYNKLKELTSDNPAQQVRLGKIKTNFEERYKRLHYTMIVDSLQKAGKKTQEKRNMIQGKMLMDQLRADISKMQEEEEQLLETRLLEQDKFIGYTPVLIIIAFLISVVITAFSYVRIKTDLTQQLEKQLEEEKKYRETSHRIALMEGVTRQISSGRFDVRSDDKGDDELGKIGIALNEMGKALGANFSELEKKSWLQEGTVRIGDAIRGQKNVGELSENILRTITAYLDIPLATLYVISDHGDLVLEAGYSASNAPKIIGKGEGLLGQAVKNGKRLIINELPAGYTNMIRSSIGSAEPAYVVIVPFAYNRQVLGAIELCLLRKPSDQEIELLENNKEAIATGINSAIIFRKMQELLEETQSQAEELEAQHGEMENLNSELEAQAQKLQASEEELRVQQEELQQSNSELEERAFLLEERNMEIRKKADELEAATRYKSEFLANMSHELRTPLNSILLLSRLLSENEEKNMNSDQVEYARVIQSSGNGLLDLIDEILDLSKIEAGKMDAEYLPVPVNDIIEDTTALFKPLAKEKHIGFDVIVHPGIPELIETDKIRIEQILKNLLSNAIKFTTKGAVTFEVKTHPENEGTLCFIVKDTGIGIPPEKQGLIFEAFQQADGSTKRKYGGTGLGLSISRELVRLLNGEIYLKSEVDKGSEFVVLLPLKQPTENIKQEKTVQRPSSEVYNREKETPEDVNAERYISSVIPENIEDDRVGTQKSDRSILIVEDDINFAKSLLDFTRKKGYKGIVSVRGDEALELARTYQPAGILLDIQLPVKSGWEVMDELKADPVTRHIPVHIMSSHKLRNKSLLKGAVDFIDKPVAIEQMKEIFRKIESVKSKTSKKVLIVEDNHQHAKALAYFLETYNIVSEVKSEVNESVDSLKKKEVDCVILDMGIPDVKSYSVLEEIKKNPELENLPIIIFTGKSLSMAEEQRIKRYADSIVVKTAHSYQRMYDEVSLFLHLVEENTQQPGRMEKHPRLSALNEILNNKTVLIVDDDVRNIFSLSKALEKLRMNVLTAIDGKEALKKLQDNPSTDVVLLDMMMPEMDGYETAKRIRENYRWKDLPVIAVTAKAMVGDREKCISAGASDYITKPVDIDQLLSLLRVWLYGM